MNNPLAIIAIGVGVAGIFLWIVLPKTNAIHLAASVLCLRTGINGLRGGA